ncbi:MAG: F0F1 ATP synthase subunit A [Firmicutes bacterium]|nr:F0F1 ATP synthase subunit A [Bacillota bacterium]
MHGSHGSDILFSIFGLPVTSYVTTMWAIMGVLLIICLFVTRRLNMVPGRLQNLVEFTVEALLNFFGGILGPEKARRYFPLLATLFLFILFSNWSGVLPGAGHVKGFRPPTSTWSVTAGLAIVVFFSVQIAGVREKGLKYLKHFIEPIPVFLPMTIIEEFVKPLSLSLRLYGNIFGEETVVAVLFSLAPYFSPIPMQMLGLLFGFIQALVFTTLTAIYIANATAEAH